MPTPLRTIGANWKFALETAVPPESTPAQVRQLKRMFYLGASSYAHILGDAMANPEYVDSTHAQIILEDLVKTATVMADELREYQNAVVEGKE